jgi:hypothetical protein
MKEVTTYIFSESYVKSVQAILMFPGENNGLFAKGCIRDVISSARRCEP